MCPACIATALMTAGSVISTGGLATIAIRKFGVKNTPDNNAPVTASKEDSHG